MMKAMLLSHLAQPTEGIDQARECLCSGLALAGLRPKRSPDLRGLKTCNFARKPVDSRVILQS